MPDLVLVGIGSLMQMKPLKREVNKAGDLTTASRGPFSITTAEGHRRSRETREHWSRMASMDPFASANIGH